MLLLISVIFAIIVIPVAASRAKNAHQGLRWTIIGILLFNLFYLFAVRFIYPRL